MIKFISSACRWHCEEHTRYDCEESFDQQSEQDALHERRDLRRDGWAEEGGRVLLVTLGEELKDELGPAHPCEGVQERDCRREGDDERYFEDGVPLERRPVPYVLGCKRSPSSRQPWCMALSCPSAESRAPTPGNVGLVEEGAVQSAKDAKERESNHLDPVEVLVVRDLEQDNLAAAERIEEAQRDGRDHCAHKAAEKDLGREEVPAG